MTDFDPYAAYWFNVILFVTCELALFDTPVWYTHDWIMSNTAEVWHR